MQSKTNFWSEAIWKIVSALLINEAKSKALASTWTSRVVKSWKNKESSKLWQNKLILMGLILRNHGLLREF